MKEIQCFKYTNDDWYPSFSLNQNEKASLVYLRMGVYDTFEEDEEDLFFICASGNDDMAIQIDYEDEEKCLKDFMSLLIKDKINIQDLHNLEGVEK